MPNEAPSLAREFYDRFLAAADRSAFLHALINSDSPVAEAEYLEFKAYPYSAKDENSRKKQISQIWSETISAFANTQGGVLIWGIHATERNKIDAAWEVKHVPNPEELKTALAKLQHQASDPPLSGIDI